MNSLRGMSLAPRPSRWLEGTWQSTTPSCLESSMFARTSNAIFDASLSWLNIDSPKKARPMARVIQEKIKRPLAEELLFGSLAEGGHVKISVGSDGELQLNSEPVLKELEHLPEGQ